MTKFTSLKPEIRALADGKKTSATHGLQVAALCFRRTKSGHKILLVTSRDTGRWVIPKGWTMRNRTEWQAAAREAYEEAGIRGVIGEESVGHFTYSKWLGKGRLVPCMVRVYPLLVREMLTTYPETGQRRVKWFTPGRAAKKVNEPKLAALIRDFDPDSVKL